MRWVLFLRSNLTRKQTSPGGIFHAANALESRASCKDRLKGGEWRNLGTLAPYLWEYKWRVVFALAFLVVRQARQRRRCRS